MVGPDGLFANIVLPNWLLHEFSHSFHDNLANDQRVRIRNVYEAAMDRHLYDVVEARVPQADGKYEIRKVPALAGRNELEYFAELSVCFLAENWAFPHTRDELRKHDPLGFALMEDVWGSKKGKEGSQGR